MKNNVLKLIKYLYYFSLITLLILYLFPGSIIGYLLYGDLRSQPNLLPNPIGTSINHTLAFLYLSTLGLISFIREKIFNQNTVFLLFLSIILEPFHCFIPNRSFELLDLFANLIGTLLAIFIIIFYKNYKMEKKK